MNKSAFRLVFVVALLLILAVSCGEDPFFFSVTVISQGTTISEEIVYSGTSFTLPIAPKGTGVFRGWLVDDTLRQPGETITISKNIVINADWFEKTEYTITYKPNYGDGKAVSKTYSSDESAVFSTPEGITKDGFVVDGWYTNSECTGTFYKTGSTITLRGDATLYAHWVDANIDADVNETAGTASVKIKESGKTAVTNVVIPDTYNGKPVTSVSKDGFKGCSALSSVEFGSSVITIAESAFEGCSALTSVTVPSSVETIGDSAFSGSGLTEISYAASSSVSEIGKNAFTGTFLSSITIPSSVKNIGEGAFSGITTATSISFDSESSLETIGKNAFRSLTGLSGTVSIPASVKTIGESVFASSSISVIGFAEDGNLETIGASAFSSCTSLSSIKIPVSVKTIGDNAFASSGITSITVDNSENSISGYESKWGATSVSVITWLRLKITYYPNGGSGASFNQSFISGSVTLSDGNSFTKEEYDFDGWNTKEDGTGTKYDGSSTVTLSSNQNLYAVWKDKYPFLTFTLNGDTYSVKVRSGVAVSGEITIPSTYYGKNVTTIEDNAFSGCTGITKVTVGSNVTSIGSSAFSGCTGMTEISIGSGVQSIGSSAFSGCTTLGTVSIPSSVTSIGNGTFSGCTTLNNVDIPSTVTSIGGGLFYGCTTLSSVTLPEGMTELKSYTEGSVTKGFFEGCTGLGSITLPSTLTKIGENGFKGSGLTSFTVPDTVTEIGKNAFSSSSLQSVTISHDLTTAEEGIFSSCTALTSVSVSEGVTKLSAGIFSGCSSLTEITLPSTITNISSDAFSSTGLTKIKLKKIDDGSFTVPTGKWGAAGATIEWTDPYVITYNLNGGTSGAITEQKIAPGKNVTLSQGTEFSKIEANLGSWNTRADGKGTQYSLGSTITPESDITLYAVWLDNYPNLTFTLSGDTYSVKAKSGATLSGEITIPDTFGGKKVSTIEDNAFSGCTGITKVTVGSNVTSIGSSAFSGCTGMTEISIGSGVQSIGSSAFSGCTTLGTVSIPSSVTSIGNGTFSGCTTLNNVDIPSTVTSIGGGLFYGCTTLSSVTLPEGMTELKSYTEGSVTKGFFEGCTGLGSITLPSTLTKIGENGFKGSGLTSFTVPDTVTEIGKNAFSSSSLQSVTISHDLTTAEEGIFSSCTALTSVSVSEGVTKLSAGIFSGCSSLTEITLPSTITNIGEGAFSSCTSLEDVIIPSGITTLGRGIFSGCTNLSGLTISDGVTELSASMFSGCTSLTSVTIPSSVTTIDTTSFSGCTGITTIRLHGNGDSFITVPDGNWGASNAKVIKVKTCTITYSANGGTGTETQSYVTGENVTISGGSAFSKIEATLKEWNTAEDGSGTTYECGKTYNTIDGNITLYAVWNENYPDLVFTLDSSSDTYSVKAKSTSISGSITIPENYGGKKVTVIEANGFYDCDSMTSITLPSTIKTIGEGAFYDSEYLTQVNIPNGIAEIKTNTFRYCSSLSSLTIPDSVKTIGSYAFAYAGLTNFVVSGEITSIADDAFYSCRKLTPTISREACSNIVSGTLTIGSEAFDSYYISSIVIDNYENAITVPSEKWGASSASITWSCQKLTFDLDGGTVDGGSTTLADAFKRGEEIILPSNVTKDGYVLDGWYTKAEAKGSFQEAATTRTMSERSDTTLYAHWVDDSLEFIPVTTAGVTTYTVSAVKSDKTGKTEYTVPSVYHGCKVTAVAAECFSSCTSATKIIIPETVLAIGNNAFSGCSALTDVEIDAFKDDVSGSPWGAGSEDKIKWQKTGADVTITYVGNGNDPSKGTIDPVTVGFRVETALSDGSGFKRIESKIRSWNTESDGTGESYELGGTYKFSKSVTLYAIWDDNYPGLTFEHKDDVEYWDYSSGEAQFAEISGWYVTAADSSLKMSRIPDEYGWEGEKEKVIGIGDYAFSSCTDLTKVEIQCTKLIYIGVSAFEGVPITEINLPDGLFTISAAAFKGTKLKSVTIPDTVHTSSDDHDIPEEVFMNCTELETVTLGKRMTALWNNYFAYCSSLESITIPDSVKTLDNYVFRNCTSLSSVTIGKGVEDLGIGVFAFCTSLTSIVLPDGLTELGGEGYLFYGCTALEDVKLPSTLKRLYCNDFMGCTSLKSIELPDGLTKIGEYTFKECGLETITIPSSVTRIDNSVFMNCTSLKEAVLSPKCSVGYYMFYNCSSLESVTIPDGVDSIGASAFYGTALKSIKIPGSVTYIDDETFENCSNLETITLDTWENAISYSPWGSSAEVVWTKFKLSYNYNGGLFTGYPEIKAVAFSNGEAVLLLSSDSIKKNGYILDGWYKDDGTYFGTDADGKHTMSENEDVSVTAYWVEDSLAFTPLTEDGEVVGYSVSASDKTRTSYTIPSVYKGKSVTEIADGGFSGCTSATGITVPDSVSVIAAGAFSGYTGTITLDVEKDKISGSPWGAAGSATITWKTSTGE